MTGSAPGPLGNYPNFAPLESGKNKQRAWWPRMSMNDLISCSSAMSALIQSEHRPLDVGKLLEVSVADVAQKISDEVSGVQKDDWEARVRRSESVTEA
jgi:hypothetical protein